MISAWSLPQGVWRASMMGVPPPPCSTRPPRIQGRPASSAAARRGVVLHHGVVVHVGDRAPLVGVQVQRREVPDHDRLEVHHEVAAERRVLEPRQQEQPRRLDGAAGHDHQLGRHGVGLAGGVDVLDTGRPPPLDEDAGDAGLGHQLGPPGGHGLVSRATGSPLAWMGQPKKAQKPQLLQAGRPS